MSELWLGLGISFVIGAAFGGVVVVVLGKRAIEHALDRTLR